MDNNKKYVEKAKIIVEQCGFLGGGEFTMKNMVRTDKSIPFQEEEHVIEIAKKYL